MKENKYDDSAFFEQYKNMIRSQKGLQGAGEWHVLQKMLPDLNEKEILDLGCGFGWHCRYAIEKGAKSVIGIDISEKMLQKAKEINGSEKIQYLNMPAEDVDYPAEKFDLVLSSLTFHYIESFETIAQNAYKWLKPNGYFVFSVEHPIFTAYGNQDWIYGNNNEKLHWPVDRYFIEGKREARFLGENVVKYHKTVTTYINGLLKQGFTIKEVIEPEPDAQMLKEYSEMKEELRRPMILLIAAQK